MTMDLHSFSRYLAGCNYKLISLVLFFCLVELENNNGFAFFFRYLLQSVIAGSSGPILNVFTPIAPPFHEFTDRILQSLPIGSLVIFLALHPSFKHLCFGMLYMAYLQGFMEGSGVSSEKPRISDLPTNLQAGKFHNMG